MSKNRTLRRSISPLMLLLAAITLHLLFTIGIYAEGRLALFQLFDQGGFSRTIILDNADYAPEVRALVETLRENGVRAWFLAPGHPHLKPYSLAFAALQPWLGFSILCAEPVNLLCYATILLLTFALGKETFDRSTGIVAAAAVALWPSFLLHTTQLLKDPLFISGLLSLVLVMTYWVTRILSPLSGLWAGLAGGAAIYLISFTKHHSWGAIILALIAVGAGLLLVRQIRDKKVLLGNVVSSILVLAAMGAVLLSPRAPLQAGASRQHTVEPPRAAYASLRERADAVAGRIFGLRHEFVRLHSGVSAEKDAGSNVDVSLKFDSALDVVRYLPRAMMIGFLAPFPNHWFAEGKKVGLAGRLISGLEMSALYLIQALMLLELWRSRARLDVWLLFGTATVGVTALALVVINLGALYRLRYGFFILLLVLAARQLKQAFILARESGPPWQRRGRCCD